MSARTFEEWKVEMECKSGSLMSTITAHLLEEGWTASRAALLADEPGVEGLVGRINKMLASKLVSLADVKLAADALLSQQARIKELEGEIAKLKGHAEAMALALDKVDAWRFAREPLAAYRRDYPEGT